MEASPIVYLEIPAPNIELARKFYSEIFGWKIEVSSLTEQKYWMIDSGSESIMSALDASKSPSKDGVVIYIKVDDIESTLSKISFFDGTVIQSKKDIGGGFGFSAIFADPNKNQIGLWSKY